MGKTSERLETYQTQMSIYAEQHKMILASDVLDMIEQLQDDLKDDVDRVVEELEEKSDDIPIQYEDNYEKGFDDGIGYAIDIVRKGCAE